MTRVLFLTESFHPVLGGGETHIRRLGAALLAAGDRATVVTRRGDASWRSSEEVDGIRVVRVRPTGPGRSGKYLMVPAAFLAILREAPGHDVLVVRGTRVLGLPGLLAARLAGLPIVLQPETNGELDATAFTWGKAWMAGAVGSLVRRAVRLRNLWLRDADRFVAMSRLIAKEMADAGIGPDRLAVIPHGVDTTRFRPPAGPEERVAVRAALGLPSGVIAMYTGRLLRGKGLETLLEAFATVAREKADLRLVLVGSGEGQALSVEEALRRRIAEGGLSSRVLLAGRHEHVDQWLRAADLFVFPSHYEGLGISLVEAAACGLPAIGTRTGGIVDVIEEGRSGLLVPPEDHRALADALRELSADEQRRQVMGAAARQVALERFDERDAVARYRTLFREVTPRSCVCPRAGAPRAGGASHP